MPKGGLGNLIALPLQKLPRADGNSVFIDAEFCPYGDQWAFLASMKRMPKDYDKTVSLLTDLHDLAVRRGQTVGFQTELEKIRQVHAAKERFLRRLAKANL